jgi:uncharacterized membrane protein (DUF373 family)
VARIKCQRFFGDDAGIVFVLREIMIKLFEHKIAADEICALSAQLLMLGCLRPQQSWSISARNGC